MPRYLFHFKAILLFLSMLSQSSISKGQTYSCPSYTVNVDSLHPYVDDGSYYDRSIATVAVIGFSPDGYFAHIQWGHEFAQQFFYFRIIDLKTSEVVWQWHIIDWDAPYPLTLTTCRAYWKANQKRFDEALAQYGIVQRDYPNYIKLDKCNIQGAPVTFKTYRSYEDLGVRDLYGAFRLDATWNGNKQILYNHKVRWCEYEQHLWLDGYFEDPSGRFKAIMVTHSVGGQHGCGDTDETFVAAFVGLDVKAFTD